MRTIILLLLLIFMGNFCKAQNTIGLPLILNYSKTDFHAGAQTWGIAQDNKGRMYFANNEGLISFDGSYWKTFPLPNRTILRSIAINEDIIYAGGQGEIGYFSPDSQGLLGYHSLLDLLPKNQLKFADIWDIDILGNAIFFRATDRIFQLSNNHIQVFFPKSEWQFITVINNRVIAQDKKNGLLYYNNKEWVPFANNPLLANIIVTGIIPTNKDSLMVTTLHNQVFLIRRDSIIEGKASILNNIPPTSIYKTCVLNKTEWVAGTSSAGCLIMNLKGEIVQQISRTEGLQNNNVLCVFLDNDKNLWAGLNNGISLIGYNSAVKYIRPGYSNELAGFSSRIFNNQLYIGTSDGAYQVPISDENKDLSFSKGVFSLIKNSNGQVWNIEEVNQHMMMGHNAGTFQINGTQAYPISSDASWLFLPLSPVLPSNNVLTGTYTGLKLLEFQHNGFVDKGNLHGTYESFRFLAMENDNAIWASHPYRGVYRLELQEEKKQYNAELFTEKDGLPSLLNNFVFKIKNRIVFATEKGAYEYNATLKKFKPADFLTAIFGQTPLRYLNEDKDGNIWFCSGKRMGVVQYQDKPGKPDFFITYFPELTGQILSGFENVYPYNSQNIFIGSEKGVIHLNLKKYLETKLAPAVLLGTVKAIGKTDSVVYGGYNSFKDKGNPDSTNHPLLQLPKTYNAFHFEYGSPHYGLQHNVEYSYQLVGYDPGWSNWTEKTEKDYTNLSDGKYSFLVKAHDNLGNESAPVVFSFIINPPIYKTAWAYMLYFLIFLLMIYLIKKWQDNNLEQQKIKYEEKQKQIIALHNLEMEKTEKEIIKLQNEKLANEVLLKKKELAESSMHLVEREDALARVKEELQKLYKKTDNNQDIKVALQLLQGIEKNNANWEQFALHFNEISNDFLKKLKTKYPALTNSDLKVCAYLQLNLSSKEIAQLMNISVRGVEMNRYRVRKKMEIPQELSLNQFLNAIANDEAGKKAE